LVQASRRFVERVGAAIEALGAGGHRVVVAVSGGPDSTALLVALHALRRKSAADVAVAHANHALRGQASDADEQFVRELCSRLHVPIACRRLPVGIDARDRDEGIEATARRLRRAFFAEAAMELNARFVATAHTADDQAETVLHRIVRGTGLAGLAGIPARRELTAGVSLIRPLLAIRRTEVLEFLAARGQLAREDLSNRDLRFTRNRLRHEVLPYLAEHLNPQVAEALVRLAAHAAAAGEAINRQVTKLRRRAVVREDARQVTFDVAPLRRETTFIICELVRQVLADHSWPLQEVGQADLQHVANLVNGDGPSWDLPGAVRATRIRGRIVIERIS
jgi:tRNA(Ile)-lysidine synthase